MVAGDGQALTWFECVPDDATRDKRLDDVTSSVRGIIVDHDDFIWRRARYLRQERIERLRDQVGPVVRTQHDGDDGHHRHTFTASFRRATGGDAMC